MSNQEQVMIENERLLNKAFHVKRDVIKFSQHETFDHFLAKCLLCWEFKQLSQSFVTESIFANGKRADVFNLSNGTAYEVVKSESNESIERKRKEYPVPLIALRAERILKHWKNKGVLL